MKIIVTAKTRAGETGVTKVDDGHYRVAVTATPQGGRANEAIIKALAEYFDVAPSRIYIKLGKTAKEKLIVIGE
ncbi:MAG: DUF167 domain-containing protein [Candidatus Andersenbacteria bacterium]|nr:DUF167 domain-containing protein [bacterium]MDZ4225243.1 DUF167 domain-containing protein [Candidatus Andersenbacteria bacterium]